MSPDLLLREDRERHGVALLLQVHPLLCLPDKRSPYMAEDANARKARLKALRAAAQEEVAAAQAQDPAVPSDEPQLKFRNYAVKDKKHIRFEPVPAAQPPKPAEPIEEEPAAEEAEQVPLYAGAG